MLIATKIVSKNESVWVTLVFGALKYSLFQQYKM